MSSGIGAGVHYPVPLHRQQAYRDLPEVAPARDRARRRPGAVAADVPRADRRADRVRSSTRSDGSRRDDQPRDGRPRLLGPEPGSKPGDPRRRDAAHHVRLASRAAGARSSGNTRASGPRRTSSPCSPTRRSTAVVLATPVDSHYELAKRALDAGKHVLIEKPLARTSAECRDLIERAARGDLTLMVGHVFLFNAAVRRMKEYIDSGELGEVRYVYSQRLNLGQVRTDVNALWNFAPHDLSILMHWLGRRPGAGDRAGLLVRPARDRGRRLHDPRLSRADRRERPHQLARSVQDPADDRGRQREDDRLRRRQHRCPDHDLRQGRHSGRVARTPSRSGATRRSPSSSCCCAPATC